MKISHKTVLGAFACAAVAASLTACAGPGYYDTAYGYGYDDGCSSRYAYEYCSYPSFEGSVIIGGANYRGLHYRDGQFGREYWYRDRWHRPDRGDRYYRRG